MSATFGPARLSTGSHRWRGATATMVGVLLLGICARLAVLTWADPWGPHHPDEHILPLEALALWEGVPPREIGWPASTTRLVLSTTMGAQWLLEEGRTVWPMRREPYRVMKAVTTWIASRYVDPAPLYRLGRGISIVTGVLQLVAMAWALHQWFGPLGAVLGTLALALAPLPVAYSQYVLADITGLLFATILVGLAAHPTPRRVMAMGLLAGLAASSKFHFGLWLLTPLLCIWLEPESTLAEKWRLSLSTLGAAAWVILTFVPWFWLNPLLALKEFAGVVLVKAGQAASLGAVPAHVATAFGGLGVLTWLGALIGLATLRLRNLRPLIPVLAPTLVGAVAVAGISTVFDRYGLVVLPGVALLAAMGWERWLLDKRRATRIAATAALAVCIVMTMTSLVGAQQMAGEIDVDVLARQWILSHVPRGRRVAVKDEDNAFLPRTAGQLQNCVQYVHTPAAYREKWLVEGVTTTADLTQPMRSAVLNDEGVTAYWCRRELDVQQDPGFYVVLYHESPRFGAMLEHDVIDEFRTGSREVTGGIDVLVLNRPIDVGSHSTQVFQTRRGQRVVYVR